MIPTGLTQGRSSGENDTGANEKDTSSGDGDTSLKEYDATSVEGDTDIKEDDATLGEGDKSSGDAGGSVRDSCTCSNDK